MAVLSFKDAAAALGFRSRSTLYRLRDDGRLAEYLRPGGRGGALLLESDPPGLPSLKEHVASCLQIRWNNVERIAEAITPKEAPDPASTARFWGQYGRWEPGPIDDEELWQNVAPIACAMTGLSAPLTPADARELWHQLHEALEDVQAGARWDAQRWAEASVRSLLWDAADGCSLSLADLAKEIEESSLPDDLLAEARQAIATGRSKS